MLVAAGLLLPVEVKVAALARHPPPPHFQTLPCLLPD